MDFDPKVPGSSPGRPTTKAADQASLILTITERGGAGRFPHTVVAAPLESPSVFGLVWTPRVWLHIRFPATGGAPVVRRRLNGSSGHVCLRFVSAAMPARGGPVTQKRRSASS